MLIAAAPNDVNGEIMSTRAKSLTSSKMTCFYKRIFPFIWFGFLSVFFLVALVKGLGSDQTSNLPFLIVPVLMAIIGYRFMKKLMFNLVDEVFDVGDALLVRSGGREERIALADIKNVNYFPYMSPPQVTLSLRRTPCLATRSYSAGLSALCRCRRVRSSRT